MKNVFEVLKEAQDFLSLAGVKDGRVSTEVLLAAVLKIPRSKLSLIHDKKLTKEEHSLINSFLQRRAKREPVAYILGSWEFMGLEFKVNENVLIPRPETELLVEEVLNVKEKESVLDLCTGSGCIAISLAKLGSFKNITASDISEKALAVAKDNASLNGIENINFVLSNIFENLGGSKFDIIVSNPPYVSPSEYKSLEPELLKYEPSIALVTEDDGLFFYKQIAHQAPKFLNKDGMVLVELNANKSGLIKDIFEAAGFKDIKIIKDYAGLDRILKARI